MNFFHKIQNFRQISDLFSQIWMKKRHTSHFLEFGAKSGKFFIKNSQRKCKIRSVCDWINEYSSLYSCAANQDSFPTPEIVVLPKRTPNQLRSKKSIATAALQNVERCFRKGPPGDVFGNVRMNVSDLVLLRSLPFSLNPSDIAPLMVNVAVSVSEDVMWKPKWPK